jgi:hypothetical protein
VVSISKVILVFRTGETEDGVIFLIVPGASPTVIDNDESDFPLTSKRTLWMCDFYDGKNPWY